MNDARLEVSFDRMLRPEGGLHTGLVLRVDELVFPFADWHDFAVPILMQWCDSMLRTIRRDEPVPDVRFFEGPFYVRFAASDPGSCRMTLVHDALQPRVVREVSAPLGILAQSVVEAAAEVLTASHERGWDDRETPQLDALVRELKEALAEGTAT
jgi:hypothetical protein